jgi:Sec-independent protein secretion pathway component TatC
MNPFSELTNTLVPIALFSAMVLSLYFFLKARNQERLAIIEKGLYNSVKPARKPFSSLKIGIFLIGDALGIFVGYILFKYTTINGVVSFFSMILLFGGIALIVNHLIERKNKKLNE